LASLTDQQRALVHELVNGVPQGLAGERAGYSHKESVSAAIRLPHVAAAVRVEITRRLVVEAAPVAYSVLLSLARDEKVPPAVRRNCARDLIGLAGWVPPKAEGAESAIEKPLTERTTHELHELVAKLESELAGRATPVNAQNAQDDEAKPLSWLD
jgi:phage terminase small subunit